MMINRIASRLGYEKRSDYTSILLTSMAAQVADNVQIIGALEAAAGIIGRALASATITGAGAGNFDAETIQDIGRRLITSGEYLGLITPGHHLTRVDDFQMVAGPLGATGYGCKYRYNTSGGAEVTTDRAIHVRYSLAADGHGAGVLDNARTMYKIAYHLERIQSEELSGIVGSVLPLPTLPVMPDGSDPQIALQAVLKDLKGKTTFVETTMQGNANGVAQPKSDYEQIKIAPRLDPQWLAACDMIAMQVYRAVGIPLTMLSENQNPSREALRQFMTLTIEPLAKLIEGAAARKSIEVDLDFGQAARFDTSGKARAWGVLVSNGYDEDLASEIVGFPIEGATE